MSNLNQPEILTNRKIILNRPAYKQKEFEDEFKLKKKSKKNSIRKHFSKIIFKFHPSNIIGVFTIINLISEYNFKKTLIADIFSGITVGVMHIPAALAYGALTSLNPVHGLYTSFFPGLTYVLFGTSKHLCVGTFALISLMVYSTITRIESEYPELINPKPINRSLFIFDELSNSSYVFASSNIEDNIMTFKVRIATTLAFWCGIFQILFSFLKLGYVSKYLSQPLLRGFTTAAAFHVLTSQLKHIFGIYYVSKKQTKFFKVIFTYVKLFQHIKSINWVAFIFSVIVIVFLLLTKTQINERFKKQLRNIPLPLELIVIVIGTLVTYFAKLDTKYDIAIVGNITKGLPTASLPDFSLTQDVIVDSAIIAVVAFASSISVSDLYARKHKYKIDSNKEFFAMGMANVVGSVFKCFVSCGSLAKTVVLESSGGKTRLVTIIASCIVLTVMLWLAPLLETLPKACLSSIIIAALLNLIKQITDMPYYWKLDKLDFLTWIITFTSSIVLDVDYGLIIGVMTVLFLNTYRNQNMEVKLLGRIKDYEIHSDINKYLATEYDSVKVVRPTHSIFYINCDFFRTKLNSLCPLTDTIEDMTICENCYQNYSCLCCCKSDKNTNAEMNAESQTLDQEKQNSKEIKFNKIVLDFLRVQFIDESGVVCLKEVINEYDKCNVKVLIANCNETVLEFLRKMKCKFDDIIYLTVSDAITA